MLREKTKSWLIIPVKVNNPLAYVTGIEYKIPEHVDTCTGIMLSPGTTFIEKLSKNHTPVLGNISLWFNSKTTHPVHYLVDGIHPKEQEGKYESLRLKESLKGGTLIQGLMEDFGKANSYPYEMKIYLECTLKCSCNDK